MKLKLMIFSLVLSTHAFAQYSGSDGWHGTDTTITANGPAVIDLSGTDGSRGSHGRNGSSGRCDSYTNEEGNTVNNDQRGEDGEDGRNGGDGGNGGSLTVLFTNLVDLKNIKFVSYGGEGGRGGDGGDGGYGCPYGSDGRRGSSGDDGRRGNLYLVGKEFQPYQTDTSGQHNSLSELISGRNIVKNIWSAIDGYALMAPDSAFRDAYMLKEYQYGSARITFKDSSLIDSRLFNHTLQVSMSEGVTTIKNSNDLLVAGKHSPDSPHASLEIERLYNAQEFKSIGFETLMKKHNGLFIHFTTDKDLLPRPVLSMKIKVELRGRFFRYHEIFNGEVPAALIETVKSGYFIDLEQLALKQKIPAKGRIRLTMTYKLQEMDIKYNDEEIWVVKLNGIRSPEVFKNDQ